MSKIQRMRSNRDNKYWETSIERRVNTIDKKKEWVVDDVLRNLLGGNIRKGARIVIQGGCHTFRTGFMYYLTTQFMQKRTEVEDGLATVLIQSCEDSLDRMISLFDRGLDINQGYLANPTTTHFRYTKPRRNRARHCQWHSYKYNCISHHQFDPETALESVNITECGWATPITTQIGTLVVPIVDREGPNYRIHPEAATADVVFQTYQIEGKFYIQVLKHRGHEFKPEMIEHKQINTYFRRYL